MLPSPSPASADDSGDSGCDKARTAPAVLAEGTTRWSRFRASTTSCTLTSSATHTLKHPGAESAAAELVHGWK